MQIPKARPCATSSALCQDGTKDLHSFLGLRVVAFVRVAQTHKRLHGRSSISTRRESCFRHVRQHFTRFVFKAEREPHHECLRILASPGLGIRPCIGHTFGNDPLPEDLCVGTAPQLCLPMRPEAPVLLPAISTVELPAEVCLVARCRAAFHSTGAPSASTDALAALALRSAGVPCPRGLSGRFCLLHRVAGLPPLRAWVVPILRRGPPGRRRAAPGVPARPGGRLPRAALGPDGQQVGLEVEAGGVGGARRQRGFGGALPRAPARGPQALPLQSAWYVVFHT
mmetsp:Transcript_87186/g.241782  ORF Transcript_87186/g.241782 Transcript_87186/m.241782 type:complete len:283 (+) Transcript_87186:253-1101(+)